MRNLIDRIKSWVREEDSTLWVTIPIKQGNMVVVARLEGDVLTWQEFEGSTIGGIEEAK